MTISNSLCLRSLDRESEVAAFRDMFHAVYGHPMSQALWQWKYAAAPNARSHNWVAAHSKTGELLGHIGAVVMPGHHPEKPGVSVNWVQIGDIMVVERARGDLRAGGVYRQLITHMQRQLLLQHSNEARLSLYAYGFPGQRPFQLGERLGYYRRLYTCKSFFYSDLLHTVSPSRAWWRSWFSTRLTLKSATVWDAKMLDWLWSQLSPSLTGPGVVKNSAYLHWRYGRHPHVEYRLWWCLKGTQPIGWLITTTDGDERVLLADSLLHPSHWPQVARALAAKHPKQQCVGWRPVDGVTSEHSPIIATEMRVDRFREHWPLPSFQPGDTDVF